MLPDDLVILSTQGGSMPELTIGMAGDKVRLAAAGADLDKALLSLVGSRAVIGHLPVEPLPLPGAANVGVVGFAFRGGLS
jgi:hypothetical protein